MKRRLIARYRYLWTWELANAFIVFPIAVFVIGRHVVVSLSTVLALLALCSVLFAGAVFAFLKYRDLKHQTTRIQRYGNAFCMLRWSIPILLIGVLVVGSFYTLTSGASDWPLALVLYLLAVAEYINYFHVQLMYDNPADIRFLREQKRLKCGLIARYITGELRE